METDKQNSIKMLVDQLRRLVRVVWLDSWKIGKQFGLTGPQSGVLRILAAAGPMSSVELSRRLYVTPSNITGIIDRLEKKELVERFRKQGDRRVVMVGLTGQGGQLASQLPDPIERQLIAGLARIDPRQAEELIAALDQILELMDAPLGETEAPVELFADVGPKS